MSPEILIEKISNSLAVADFMTNIVFFLCNNSFCFYYSNTAMLKISNFYFIYVFWGFLNQKEDFWKSMYAHVFMDRDFCRHIFKTKKKIINWILHILLGKCLYHDYVPWTVPWAFEILRKSRKWKLDKRELKMTQGLGTFTRTYALFIGFNMQSPLGMYRFFTVEKIINFIKWSRKCVSP